jgi:hypothetical protein
MWIRWKLVRLVLETNFGLALSRVTKIYRLCPGNTRYNFGRKLWAKQRIGTVRSAHGSFASLRMTL